LIPVRPGTLRCGVGGFQITQKVIVSGGKAVFSWFETAVEKASAFDHRRNYQRNENLSARVEKYLLWMTYGY
jgi:hypothetical protein